MATSRNYVAYFDLLGIGDSSEGDKRKYFEDLLSFKGAICAAVDKIASDGDEIYAFSDCAFVSSASLSRVIDFASFVQNELWFNAINLKGAICAAPHQVNRFSELLGDTNKSNQVRAGKLKGYWFGSEFVQPALLEKNLSGIGVLVDKALWQEKVVVSRTVFSAFYPRDGGSKPIVFRDLSIPQKHLRPLDDLLKQYLLLGHRSKKIARSFVSLIITWVNSHSYESMAVGGDRGAKTTAPTPYRQLIENQKLAAEIVQMPGSELIYYALLSKVFSSCSDASVHMRIIEWVGANKRLRMSADLIPDQICSRELRNQVIENRVGKLISSPVSPSKK